MQLPRFPFPACFPHSSVSLRSLMLWWWPTGTTVSQTCQRCLELTAGLDCKCTGRIKISIGCAHTMLPASVLYCQRPCVSHSVHSCGAQNKLRLLLLCTCLLLAMLLMLLILQPQL